MRRFGVVLILYAVFIHWLPPVYADNHQDMVKVSVLPLVSEKGGKYSYLDSSLRQMLVSRLAHQGTFEIIESKTLTEETDRLRKQLIAGNSGEILTETGTELIVDGSLYSLKDGIQLNVTLYQQEGDTKQTRYSVKAESPEEIISAISDLAVQIDQDVAGAQETQVAEGGSPTDKTGTSGFQTPHPERDYKKGLFGGGTLFGGEDDERFTSKGVRKSSTIPYTIETVTLGDLDGDGKDELVVASRSKIRVFHFADRRFREVAGYDLTPYFKIHVINIADPGNSGTRRLFVSADKGKTPSSLVLGWDGSKELQLVRENINWYIRPVWWPGKEVILAGQKDSPNISDNFLAPGVFELTGDLAQGQPTKGFKLLLPKGTNLFDFIVADLNGDKEVETMVIDRQQKLLVYDSGLNLSWVSSANYGGSKKFFGPAISQADDKDPLAQREDIASQRDLVFIPGRLDLKDITGDGLPEVVVSTNDVGFDKYLANVRTYNGGAVACLTWRGSGLMELWRTNHLPGYVADYVFEEEAENSDGTSLARLYVAQIPDSSMWELILPGRHDSKMLAYEMTIKKENEAGAGQQ